MTDAWAFGWTQLLTILGFLLTGSIAAFGFRSFERWRMEKLEERRIDVAIEALALAYEAKYVFQEIRSPMSFDYEANEMPKWEGETEQQYNSRKPYFAIVKRVERNEDFFERLFQLQPRFMALFGADKEEMFMKCHKARRFIEVSAGMLMKATRDLGDWNENRQRQRDQWESDIWEGNDEVVENLPTAKRVSDGIKGFQEGIVTVCKPIAERKRIGIGRFSQSA